MRLFYRIFPKIYQPVQGQLHSLKNVTPAPVEISMLWFAKWLSKH